MSQKAVPSEALVDLRRRLVPFPPRSAERRGIMRETAAFYGVSEATLYRALRERARPRPSASCPKPVFQQVLITST